MDKGTLSLLLKKFRQGTCTPEEQQLLYKWLDALEQDDTSPASLSAAERQTIKQEMQQQIFPVAKNNTRLLLMRVAAVVLPLVIASYFILHYKEDSRSKQYVADKTWHTVHNTGNHLQKVILPDHSIVLLGRYSTIQFPEHFSGPERPVKILEGKAFFETVTDTRHPFIVEDASGIRTTVLGTSFTVETSRTLRISRVAVATGKVKVQGVGTKPTVLLPAQRLTFRENNTTPRQDSISTDDLMAWTKEEIVLRNATLQELLLTIKNQYGITATTSLNVNQGNYTIRFPATMALPEVLDIIQKISYKPKIHFTMQKDQLSIY
ncbi:FecR family protein [Chitinophaga sp. CF118]|uniref:FecR family protein n=1 Tax=Chitinophaga sp. CF118 TaxID=1884367 RepID=UPI0008F31906|nr:FecR domain-containing protein [Chitinophaga sp. CF118]SFD20049.1 FecR family protein [Chitinophaga sp. CF118]